MVLNKFKIIAVALVTALSVSCVPVRKYEEVKGNSKECDDELEKFKAKTVNLETTNKDLTANITKAKQEIEGLNSDTTILGRSLRTMQIQYDKINRLNDELMNKQGQLRANSERESYKLTSELEIAKLSLQKKEDELNTLETELKTLEGTLKTLETTLNDKEKNLVELDTKLKEREQRVNELEDIIAKKDAAVKALKDKVTKALKGFINDGLTIEQKNGRIYVSMEAKLLFASGSTVVDARGKGALNKLAGALEGQNDIEILVEGHTDEDKLSSPTFPKDNWDLSVLRATSVVKILLDKAKIDPTKVSAAGRSQFLPLDPADKAKNRRIEVILIPNLDELYKVIEQS